MLPVKLFGAVGPGVPATLLASIEVPPNAHNAYPELIVWNGGYFLQTPIRSEYRKIEACAVDSSPAPVVRRTRGRPLLDGQWREIKPRAHQFARLRVTAQRMDSETPYVHLHGMAHLGELDDTAHKSLVHMALEDHAVTTLIDQLQRALDVLPTSK